MVRDAVLRRRLPIYIDFSETTQMVSDGTLLFYAEVYRLSQLVNSNKMIRCSYPKNQIVEQVLQQVGIFSVIGKPGKANIKHESVKYWNSATGIEVEGKKVAPIHEYCEGTMASPLTTSTLYDGIVEAMTNCIHHAYPKKDEVVNAYVNKEPRWWMFSQERDGELSVVFCDLGIGIPTSLLNGERWSLTLINNILRKLNLFVSDAALIRAAFEVGKSQTKERHRGKGLQNIKEVLDHEGQGNVRVLSGRGYYTYNAEELTEKTRNFHQTLSGTLIVWRIPVRVTQTDGK